MINQQNTLINQACVYTAGETYMRNIDALSETRDTIRARHKLKRSLRTMQLNAERHGFHTQDYFNDNEALKDNSFNGIVKAYGGWGAWIADGIAFIGSIAAIFIAFVFYSAMTGIPL